MIRLATQGDYPLFRQLLLDHTGFELSQAKALKLLQHPRVVLGVDDTRMVVARVDVLPTMIVWRWLLPANVNRDDAKPLVKAGVQAMAARHPTLTTLPFYAVFEGDTSNRLRLRAERWAQIVPGMTVHQEDDRWAVRLAQFQTFVNVVGGW